MSNLNARLSQCFSLVFPDLALADIPGANLTNVAAWDSVASITLLAVLEEEFHISIDFEEFGALDSYEKVHHWLKQKTASN